jgi:D-arabinose 1-dehydrogenase-like Zn-dependent alcohol dehydrogenase
VPIAKTYTMDEIATAHDDMEHDRVAGKLVVSTGRGD